MTTDGLSPRDRWPDMTVIVVAAIAANGAIGAGGDLVWRDSNDLKRVKAMTMGHTLVMGRKNFDSIGRALPGRRTVVVTRQPDWAHDGVTVVQDTGDGLAAALRQIVASTGDDTVFVFGGGEIYAALLPRADVMELTEVAAEIPGDVFFPPVDWHRWRLVTEEPRDGFRWARYERVREAAGDSER